MLERMFINHEKQVLAEDRKLSKDDPGKLQDETLHTIL